MTAWHNLSLTSRGARFQFTVAVFLISILPALTMFYLMIVVSPAGHTTGPAPRVIVLTTALLVALGFFLLADSMKAIGELRRHLERIARGDLPESVRLAGNESDIAAIEKYLNLILFQTRWKLQTMEQQRQNLIDAERQRVMIESLGTACHHMGQPITAITVYLELMRRNEGSEDRRRMIEECIVAVESLRGVIEKLRTVSEYRTIPYLSEGSEDTRADARILDLPKPPA